MLAEAFRTMRENRVVTTLKEYRTLRNQGMEPVLPLPTLPTLNDFRLIGQIHRLRTAQITRMKLRGESVPLAQPFSHLPVESGDKEIKALWQQIRSPFAIIALEFIYVPLFGFKEKIMRA